MRSLFTEWLEKVARPRRFRSVPRHQLGRRRVAGRRDMDGRELTVSHLGRAVLHRSSADSRGRSRTPESRRCGRGGRWIRCHRRRGRRRSVSSAVVGLVVTAGGIVGVGGGCGFGIGRPVSKAATTSAMNVAWARVRGEVDVHRVDV